MTSIYALRAYNYFYFSLLSIFISFLPIYYSSQGISAAQIGIIIGAGALTGIISQPLWGIISDRYKTVKKVILLILLLSIGLGVLLLQLSAFTSILLLTVLLYFFFLPTDPLTESLNYRISQERGISFGSIRMYGAIGYATASLITGYVADGYGMGSLAVLFAIFGVATVLSCFFLPDVTAARTPVSLRALGQFFTYRKTLWFFALVFLTALPHRMNDHFLGVAIQSLGGSTGLVGQAWFWNAVSEVVFFAISFWFLNRMKEVTLISLAAACYTIRYFLCSLAVTPEQIVALQLMQGITFVIFYTAAIQYLYKVVPEEWKSTGQTVLAILFFGISGMVGSVLGGWVLDHFGTSSLFLMMAGLSFASLLFSLFLRSRSVEAAN
ncbi:MFS transporter [Brevibacillus fluminis]|uniref:MFS transporter n=1 Tax=Brevibacillus fluminis TaxID=511487 RepID=A0A3M8DGT9_9BACL|nr:MFS transporter [Brevibacillus fluminis]RNB87312.1 MFS transporter [Brevibacillus fluminis]